MVDKSAIGKKIYALRKKTGFTQDTLAKLVNVTPQAISKWENGITLPDTFLLPVLAGLFQVSIEELLCLTLSSHQSNNHTSNNKFMLSGLICHAATPSLVSCIKSSLDYIGVHVSLGWISAPYAFMLNINEEVSHKGPEFWNDRGCFDELIRNCGGIVNNYHVLKQEKDFEEKQIEARNMIRDSINKGLPCYAWEMEKPQYYLLAGYDEVGYYYIEPETTSIKGPKPYMELGSSDWGVLEIHIIRPGTISDNLKTIKDIFEYAIDINNPDIYKPNAGYTMGVKAYEVWWKALEKGNADPYGLAYNASFWAKCKEMAVLFLEESKLRLGAFDDLFNKAIVSYERVLKKLNKLAALTQKPLSCKELSDEAVNLLKDAYENEKKGLGHIMALLNEFYKIW